MACFPKGLRCVRWYADPECTTFLTDRPYPHVGEISTLARSLHCPSLGGRPHAAQCPARRERLDADVRLAFDRAVRGVMGNLSSGLCATCPPSPLTRLPFGRPRHHDVCVPPPLRRGGATDSLHDRLCSIFLTDEQGWESDGLDIALDDRSSRISFTLMGEKISLASGYGETSRTSMGRYAPDEMELQHPAFTPHEGNGFYHCRPQVSRTCSLDEVLVGDLIARIAASHGLTSRVSPSLAGYRLVHLDQTEESDLHLLTRLGKELDALVAEATGRQLLFLWHTPSEAPHIRLSETECLSWSLRVRARSSARENRSLGCVIHTGMPHAVGSLRSRQSLGEALSVRLSELSPSAYCLSWSLRVRAPRLSPSACRRPTASRGSYASEQDRRRGKTGLWDASYIPGCQTRRLSSFTPSEALSVRLSETDCLSWQLRVRARSSARENWSCGCVIHTRMPHAYARPRTTNSPICRGTGRLSV